MNLEKSQKMQIERLHRDDLIIVTDRQTAYVNGIDQKIDLDMVEYLKMSHILDDAGHHKHVPSWEVWRVNEAVRRVQARRQRHLTPADKLDNMLSQMQRRDEITSYSLLEAGETESENREENIGIPSDSPAFFNPGDIKGHIMKLNPGRRNADDLADDIEEELSRKFHAVGLIEKRFLEPDTGFCGEHVKVFFHVMPNETQ